MLRVFSFMLLGNVVLAANLFAADVSFVSGIYQTEKSKIGGRDGGGKSAISLGGRYTNALSADTSWLGEVQVALRSYSAADGQTAPDDSTSMALFGGARWYFLQFSDNVLPFLTAKAGYKNTHDATPSQNRQTTASGLYYYGSGGFRFWASETIFLEIESNFFESALFATEETKAIDPSEDGAPEKSETTKSELFVSSQNGIESVLFGIGMKL